jgi:anti-sigma regulatory factor (Ser/Thr protein kinase)
VELPREVNVPRLARWLLAERFSALLDRDTLASGMLLVSELVTNAVRYGRGMITLKAVLSDDRLLVEVIAQGSGFAPALDEHDLENGGWGLRIVDAEASRSGVQEGATHVRFELDTPDHDPSR